MRSAEEIQQTKAYLNLIRTAVVLADQVAERLVSRLPDTSRLLDRLDRPLLELNTRQFAKLSDKEQRTLIRLLEKVR